MIFKQICLQCGHLNQVEAFYDTVSNAVQSDTFSMIAEDTTLEGFLLVQHLKSLNLSPITNFQIGGKVELTGKIVFCCCQCSGFFFCQSS